MAIDINNLEDNDKNKVKKDEIKHTEVGTHEKNIKTNKKRNKNTRIKKSNSKKKIISLICIIIFILLVIIIYNVLFETVKEEKYAKINLVINNSNVTSVLKHDVIINDGIVYLSKEDISNFYDGEIYYDETYNQIVTASETKLAVLPIDSDKITVNGSDIKIYAKTYKDNNVYYIPFSEIGKTVFDVETTYIEKSNVVKMVSLDKSLTYANSNKNNTVKNSESNFSKAVDKIKKGDNVTVVTTDNNVKDGWTKIITENGKVGYVKTNTLANVKQIREDLIMDKQIDGKVSMVWDYFSQYVSAPTRTDKIQGVNVVSPSFFFLLKSGNGNILANVGSTGEDYINWAHNNGYKVWAIFSNESLKDTTSTILNDFKLRENLINNILTAVETYNLDGINLDFESIYEADKDEYTKLVMELKPRLAELGKVLSVDVTAPDGSPDWSLCFNRNKIGKIADYIVYMAYDEYGSSSTKAGTTSGYDWVEKNINKFLNQEEVSSDKIILGLPFYTRLWTVTGTESATSKAIDMNKIDNALPSNAEKKWLEDEKQYYSNYTSNGKEYKIWIEDITSFKTKLELVNTNSLAGAAYWEKDKETEDVWQTVSETLDIK